jgi:sugar-specific transcriptional regulator TrmB
MSESDAVDALEELGLARYEARVFIALQKLGIASASDIDRATDVPRSQVYGTTESLEQRGLVEIQQSNPMKYRAVNLDEARETLRKEFEREESTAFNYLKSVRENRPQSGEQQEDIWTVRGTEQVSTRIRDLASSASDHLVYGADETFFDEGVAAALVKRAASDIDVTVLTGDDVVADRFESTPITVLRLPDERASEKAPTGRVLSADGDTLLLSVAGGESMPRGAAETAVWSRQTGFAVTLNTLLSRWFEMHLGESPL